MSENKPLTKLSTLGEFGLIRHLTQDIKLKNESSLKGVGEREKDMLHHVYK